MARNIPRTLLLAVVYTALSMFASRLIQNFSSQEYREAVAALSPALIDYGFMLAGGLICAITSTIGAASGKGHGIGLYLPLMLACFLCWQVMPNFSGLALRGTPGTASMLDTLFILAGGLVVTALFVVLTMLCIPKLNHDEPPKEKATAKAKSGYNLNIMGLILRIVLLAFVYLIFYFVSWYFLLWRFEAARIFFSGVAETPGFAGELVNMLLTNAILIPIQLLKGLAYALAAFIPLRLFLDKRLTYIIFIVLLFLSEAVGLLAPSPLIPADVRMAMLLERGVVLLVFGALTAFLLHTCYTPAAKEEETHTAPVPRSGAAKARPDGAPRKAPAPPPPAK